MDCAEEEINGSRESKYSSCRTSVSRVSSKSQWIARTFERVSSDKDDQPQVISKL